MPRFMRKGTTRFYFLPTIAAATKIPTVAEIAAGTRLDPQLGSIDGFSFANSPIQVPNMAETFTPSIPGEDAAADSSLGFYELRTETDTIRTSQVKGATGFIVIFYGGPATTTVAVGDKVDVWPVQIASNAKAYTAGNEAAMYNVAYTISAAPTENASIIA